MPTNSPSSQLNTNETKSFSVLNHSKQWLKGAGLFLLGAASYLLLKASSENNDLSNTETNSLTKTNDNGLQSLNYRAANIDPLVKGFNLPAEHHQAHYELDIPYSEKSHRAHAIKSYQRKTTAINPLDEFSVSDSTDNLLDEPSIFVLPNGNAIVAWGTYSYRGGGYIVYAREVNLTNYYTYNQFGVSTYIPVNIIEEGPKIAGFSDNSYMVVWNAHFNHPLDPSFGCIGQLFSSSGIGNKVGGELLVNSVTTAMQARVVITHLANNNAVAAWEDAQTGFFQISAQIFSPLGAKLGSQFFVNTNTVSTALRAFSCIASFNNGNFVISWTSNQGGSNLDIYAQLFSSGGGKIGGEFLVNTYLNYDQMYSAASTTPDNKFFITWVSYNQDGSGAGIYGQLFDSSGSRIGNELQINTYTQGDQLDAAVLGLNNSFLVAWSSEKQTDFGWDVYGQLISTAGNRIGGEFRINTAALGDQKRPALSALPGNQFVAVWLSERVSRIMYLKIFSNTIAILPSNPAISYTEDQILLIEQPLVVTAPAYNPSQNLTLTIAFTDSNAGQLLFPAVPSNTVFSSNGTGVWQLRGPSEGINDALVNVLFNPSKYYAKNVTLTLQAWDGVNTTVTNAISLLAQPVDNPPVLDNNNLIINQGDTVIITQANLRAEDVDNNADDLIFIISNVQYGQFEAVDNPNVAITTFLQRQVRTNQIQFRQDGSANTPAYLASVSDGSLVTTPSPASVTLLPPLISDKATTSTRDGIIGGVVGGGAVAAGLIGFGIYRYRKAQALAKERAQHPFANFLRSELNLKGVDDFTSDQGKYYLNAADVLTDALEKEGFSIKGAAEHELMEMVKPVAEAVKTVIGQEFEKLGQKTIISAAGILNNSSEIAKQAKDKFHLQPAQQSLDVEMANISLRK